MVERWVIKPGTNTVVRWDGLPVEPGDLIVMPVRELREVLRDLEPFLRHTLGETGNWPYDPDSPNDINPRLRAALDRLAFDEGHDG